MAYVQLPNLLTKALTRGLGDRKLFGTERRLLPGRSRTYAKGDDQHEELRHSLCAGKVNSLNMEWVLRAVTLGHAYKPAVEAAYRRMQLGANLRTAKAVFGAHTIYRKGSIDEGMDNYLEGTAGQARFQKTQLTVISRAYPSRRGAFCGR